ncbi:hypothetical protein [Streptomyces hydrogenans]|uniref:hypothetical protein n=1 Tax=Streptomyces hydrogenans TaxID=1873719 RepID=UPI0035D69707
MLPNDEAPRGAHTVEHDEKWDCDRNPSCDPVKEKPVTSLANAVKAIPVAGVGHNYRGHPIDAADAYDLVRDLVAVPDTGTWLVTDGAVHTAGASGGGTVVHTRYEPGRTIYTFTVRAFFEEGKTYRREYTTSGKRQTFMADRVVSEDGVRFAFGRCETDGYGVDWVVRRQHHWDGAGWEEVR